MTFWFRQSFRKNLRFLPAIPFPERSFLSNTASVSGEFYTVPHRLPDETAGISGNYTTFAQKETMQVGDYAVTFSYDSEDTPALALWSGDEMLYSLDGLTMEEAEVCILSLARAYK